MDKNNFKLITIKDCSEIDIINDAIHDCWFDVAKILVDYEASEFKLIYEKEVEEKSEVIRNFYLMRKVKIPIIECNLSIKNVSECNIQDSENVERYDLTRIDCNNSLGEVTITTGVPILINLKVDSILISIELTDRIIGYKTKFTL